MVQLGLAPPVDIKGDMFNTTSAALTVSLCLDVFLLSLHRFQVFLLNLSHRSLPVTVKHETVTERYQIFSAVAELDLRRANEA